MAQTTRLASFGPVCVIAGRLVHLLDRYNLNITEIIISIWKTRTEIKNDIPMAQTTCLASFGPVCIIAGLLVHLLVRYDLNTTEIIISIKKHEQKLKMIHTYGPNDARRVVWAQFRQRWPPSEPKVPVSSWAFPPCHTSRSVVVVVLRLCGCRCGSVVVGSWTCDE
jgi:hypothetical protein